MIGNSESRELIAVDIKDTVFFISKECAILETFGCSRIQSNKISNNITMFVKNLNIYLTCEIISNRNFNNVCCIGYSVACKCINVNLEVINLVACSNFSLNIFLIVTGNIGSIGVNGKLNSAALCGIKSLNFNNSQSICCGVTCFVGDNNGMISGISNGEFTGIGKSYICIIKFNGNNVVFLGYDNLNSTVIGTLVGYISNR